MGLTELNRQTIRLRINRVLKSVRPDAVVTSSIASPDPVVPVIFDVQDDNPSYWATYAHDTRFAKKLARYENSLISTATATVAASEIIQEKIQKMHPESCVFYIPNGVNVAQFRKEDSRTARQKLGFTGSVLGYLGRVGPWCRLEMAIQSLAFLPDRFNLVVVGRLSDQHRFLAVAKEAGVSDRVELRPPVPESDVPLVCAGIDVGLIPFDLSDFCHAAFPLKLLEYSAAGKPVVSTPLRTVLRLHLPNVYVCQPHPESVAKVVLDAMSLKHVSLPAVGDFDWATLARRYASRIEEALSLRVSP